MMDICDLRQAEQQIVPLSVGGGNLAKVIGKIRRTIGNEGTIVIEAGTAGDHSVEYCRGMRFGRGYVSPEFATGGHGNKVVIEAPHVLLTDKRVAEGSDLLPILERVNGTAGNLMLLAEDVEDEALETLLGNNTTENFKCVAIRAPGFGDRRKAILEDIATLVGGQVISRDRGRTLSSVTMSDLGRASRVIADNDETIIVGGKGSQEAIDSRMRQIKAQAEAAVSEYERGRLEERLAKLAGGVAVVRTGSCEGATNGDTCRKNGSTDLI